MIQFDEHIFQLGWFNHQLAWHFLEQKRDTPSFGYHKIYDDEDFKFTGWFLRSPRISYGT